MRDVALSRAPGAKEQHPGALGRQSVVEELGHKMFAAHPPSGRRPCDQGRRGPPSPCGCPRLGGPGQLRRGARQAPRGGLAIHPRAHNLKSESSLVAATSRSVGLLRRALAQSTGGDNSNGADLDGRLIGPANFFSKGGALVPRIWRLGTAVSARNARTAPKLRCFGRTPSAARFLCGREVRLAAADGLHCRGSAAAPGWRASAGCAPEV